ncbi:hypothetical protein EVAR_34392_1 [Eumeta japonica]|uniref:Uncharacterized protein n=1 Tax=Eumeta variegata TaxID=151549 RepID=A0A4C1WVU9_EUMVA|nr:hypothetical protein EVAR_34392_1 [Eumeta japonica]
MFSVVSYVLRIPVRLWSLPSDTWAGTRCESIWNYVHEKQPTIFTPEQNGWRLEENQFHFHWFDGDQLPRDVGESLQQSEEDVSNNITDDDEDDDDSVGQYHDWLNDENSNNCYDDCDD